MESLNEDEIRDWKRHYWTKPGSAGVYNDATVMAQNGITRINNRVERSIVLQHAEGLILDAGTGIGRFAIPLAHNQSNSVVALDYSAEMLRFNRECSATEGLDITYLRGDIERLPFSTATFDTVVSIWVVRHFPQYQNILKEYARVLKPGGKMIFEMRSEEHIACANRLVPKFGNRFGESYEVQVPFSALKDFLNSIGIEVIDRVTYGFFNENHFHKILTVNDRGYNALYRLMSMVFANRLLQNLAVWSELSFMRHFPPGFSYNYFVIGRKRQ